MLNLEEAGTRLKECSRGGFPLLRGEAAFGNMAYFARQCGPEWDERMQPAPGAMKSRADALRIK